MMSIAKTAPNRVEIDLEGSLDANAMETALDRLLALSDGVSAGRMLYRVTNFEMPTLGVIAVELRRLPSLFSLIGKFDKCAVLSDTSWIRTWAEVEGALIPGLEIRAFELHEAAEAERWLAKA